MSDIGEARTALVRRILEGEGKASPSDRWGAFNNGGLTEDVGQLIDKVARHACRVTDAHIGGVRRSGLREDQIFELVVCAAVGQATRQYASALAALDAATGKGEHAAGNS